VCEKQAKKGTPDKMPFSPPDKMPFSSSRKGSQVLENQVL